MDFFFDRGFVAILELTNYYIAISFQASTELNCCSRKDEFLSDEALIEKNAVEIVKQMQKLRGIDGEYDSETGKTT